MNPVDPQLFAAWLNYDKTKRELTCKIDHPINKIKLGQFSYIRLIGLNELAETLKSLTDDQVAIFRSLQDTIYHQLVNDLFHFTLELVDNKDTTLSVGIKLSPVTTDEKQKALEIIQTILTLHPAAKNTLTLQNRQNPVQAILKLIDVTPLIEVTIGVLIALLRNSSAHQQLYQTEKGTEKILLILKNKTTPNTTRLKCVELVQFIIKDFIADAATNKTKLNDALGSEAISLLSSDNGTQTKREEFLHLIDRRT